MTDVSNTTQEEMTNRPFKLIHKSSGLFYRPCAFAKDDITGKYVKTNFTKTGGKIYTKDPRKHIKFFESHTPQINRGIVDSFVELEIVYI